VDDEPKLHRYDPLGRKKTYQLRVTIGQHRGKDRDTHPGLAGGVVNPSSPTDFKTHVASEVAKWGKVVRTANIRPE
jgi:hypothetical protein